MWMLSAKPCEVPRGPPRIHQPKMSKYPFFEVPGSKSYAIDSSWRQIFNVGYLDPWSSLGLRASNQKVELIKLSVNEATGWA